MLPGQTIFKKSNNFQIKFCKIRLYNFITLSVNQIRSLSASRLGSKFQAAPDPENFKAESKIAAEPKRKNSKKNEDENSYYKVAFDYQADNPDELTLNVGDIIKVSQLLETLKLPFIFKSAY